MPRVAVKGPNPFSEFMTTLNDVRPPKDATWELPPPGIREFVESKGYLGLMPLSTRQYRMLAEGLGQDGEHLFDASNKYHELVLLLGKGCIDAETPLYDFESGRTMTARQWAEEGSSIQVLSESSHGLVLAYASPVYKKGKAAMYRVRLADGRSVRVTAAHRFLTPEGWKHTSELTPGESQLRVLSPSANPQMLSQQRVAVGSSFPSSPPHSFPKYSRVLSVTLDGEADFYDLTVPGTHSYFDANGILHHNSGKDFMAAVIIAYITYVLLCLSDPQAFLDIARSEPLDIVNVATTKEQARDVFFKKLSGFLSRPCYSRWVMKRTVTKVSFPEKNIFLHSLHSQAQKWEGFNVLAWVMDEADAFRTVSGGNQNAREVHTVLTSSATSRFPGKRWVGFIISYPRSEDGFVLTYKSAVEKLDSAYVDQAATWEVHPHYDSEHPLFQDFPWVEANGRLVPKPYENDFLLDPTTADMTYRCIPPQVEHGFFEYPERLGDCIDVTLKPAIDWNPGISSRTVKQWGQDPETGDRIELPLEREFVSVELIPGSETPAENTAYYIHCDPGETKDSFALAMCHALPELIQIETLEETLILNRVIVDLVLEWKPDPTRPVDYTNAGDVILYICSHWPVVQVSFDKFQSAALIQRLLEREINAISMGFGRQQQIQMYRALKAAVYATAISWSEETALRLGPQLAKLQWKGGQITHAAEGKDVADAVTTAAFHASGAGMTVTQRDIMETMLGGTLAGVGSAGSGMAIAGQKGRR